MEDVNMQIQNVPEVPKEFIQKEFKKLADGVMNHLCILNGKYEYHPIEIEFYVYTEDHQDIHVYPRNAEKPCDLFFHLSGMDICFESSMETGRFGGILIRALERNDGKLIGGPLTCVNEVLNNADRCSDIHVEACADLTHTAECIGKRKGINQSTSLPDKYWDAHYRYLRDDFHVGDKITMEDESFDFKSRTHKKSHKRYYKIEL